MNMMNTSSVSIRWVNDPVNPALPGNIHELVVLQTLQRKCNTKMLFGRLFAAISKETVEVDVDLSDLNETNTDDRETLPGTDEYQLSGRDTIPEIDRETLEIMLQPALAVVMLAA